MCGLARWGRGGRRSGSPNNWRKVLHGRAVFKNCRGVEKDWRGGNFMGDSRMDEADMFEGEARAQIFVAGWIYNFARRKLQEMFKSAGCVKVHWGRGLWWRKV